MALQQELLPWLYGSAVALLRSGWPVFGLLSLVAYKVKGIKRECEQLAEAFLVRYEVRSL